ncbi:unnamed protein product [Arabidopsis halleri]
MDLESPYTLEMLNAPSQYIDMNEEDAQDENIEMNEGEIEIEEPEQSDTQAPRKRRLTLVVWNHFVLVGTKKDGKERGKCIHCGTKLVINTKTHGTKSLIRQFG